MERDYLSRADLHNQLVEAAVLRAVITMGSILPMLSFGAFLVAVFGGAPNRSPLPIIVFFGGSFLVCWAVTELLCKRIVTCPFCGGSLWECGTGNFKARRMRIKEGVDKCPHCRVPII